MASSDPTPDINMIPFSVEYLSTPSRYNRGGEGDDPDTDSSSPGNNTSGGSPSLQQALSGEDAIESPPLRARLPPHAARRPAVSSPSDPEEDSPGTSPASGSNAGSADKPSQSYIALISMAILQHPERKMLLGDIYQFIMDRFPHYRNTTDKAWRNSIRHNLSINECFIKVGRADNGKGNYWAIHPACVDDFAKGDFRRRQARRRARRSQQVNVSKMPLTYRYSLGYVPMKSTPTSGGHNGTGSYVPSSSISAGVRAHPYAARGQHYSYEAGKSRHHAPQSGSTVDYAQYSPYSVSGSPESMAGFPSSAAGPTRLSPLLNYQSGGSPPGLGQAPSPAVRPTTSYNGQMASDTMGIYGIHAPSYQNLSPTSTTNLTHTQSQLQHQQQQQQQSTTRLASCLYQTATEGFNASPPTAAAVAAAETSPDGRSPTAGALYGTSSSFSLPFCFSDMPALRDAITGLSSLSS